MAFPTDRLDFKCEIAFGVDPNGVGFINPPSWSDVTPYFLDQTVQINRGRANETDDTQVMSMSFELDNEDGVFTPDNAESILYPFVRRGTIMRYGIYGGDCHFQYTSSVSSLDAALSTPDNAALDITGDIEIQFEVQPAAIVDLTILAGKYNPTGNQRSWYVFAQPDPAFPNFYRLGFEWSTDGTLVGSHAATTPYVFAYHNKLVVKITVDVNNGSGNHEINFYTARDWGEDWTLLANVVGSGTTSIFSSTAPLEVGGTPNLVGDINWIGKIWRLVVMNGIAGTVVANLNTRVLDPGDTGFTDTAGRVWTVGVGGVIENFHERFFGNVDSWQVTWPYGDTTGDVAPESRVLCQASSVRRRLGQGDRPLPSPLRRRTTTGMGSSYPLAYWPFEDEEDSTQIANAIPNGAPGQVNDLANITLGADVEQLVGSASAAQITTNLLFTGDVPVYTGPTPNGFCATSFWKIFSDITINQKIIRVYMTGGTVAQFVLAIDSTTQYRIQALNAIGGVIDEAVGNHSDLYVNNWGCWLLNAIQSGANIIYSGQWFRYDNDTTVANFGGQSTFAGTLGNVDYITIEGGSQTSGSLLAHVAVQPGAGNVFGAAPVAYTGEESTQRFGRICGEESVACNFGIAPPELGTELGPQPIDSILNIFQNDVAVSSNSIFLDARWFRGLQLINLYDLLNNPVQLALDAAAEHITNPLSPTLDDQNLRNAIESSRPGGSSFLASDPDSVDGEGEYLDQVSVNVASDLQLGDDANWRLHIGVNPEMSYPPITMELGKNQEVADALIPVWLDELTDVGCRVTLENLPRQADTTIKQFLLQGYTETISPTKWTVTLNCTPYEPYMVTWFDNDYVELKLSPINTELSDPIDDDDTVFNVTLLDGDEWTTDPEDMPILIEILGEQMEVTAIGAESAGEQQFTVTRSINGVEKSHVAGEEITLAYPAFLSLV